MTKSTISDRYRNVTVVAGSFVCHFVIMGLSLSFGILYSELHTEFNVSQSQAAWVASLFCGLIGVAGIPVGYFVIRFGECKITALGALLLASGMLTSSFVKSFNWFYLTFGLVGGLGSSLSIFPAVTIIMRTFSRNRPLAVAISSSGTAIGNLVLPPLLSHSIDKYGWRATFILLGGLSLHCLPAALVFISDVQKELKEKTGFTIYKTSTCAIVKNLKFMLFGVSVVLTFLIIFAPATFLPDLMKSRSLSAQEIYISMMTMGTGHFIGRLAPGVFERLFRSDLLNMYMLVLFIGSVISVAHVFAATFTLFLILAAFIGIISGACLCLNVALIGHYLEKEHTEVGYSLIGTFQGTAIVIGIPVTGFIIDMTQTVRSGFLFIGGVMLLSLIIAFMTRCTMIKKKRKEWITKNNKEIHVNVTMPP